MRERTIFMAALDFDDPAERWAFLDESCRGSPELRKRVEALIHSHEQDESFLNSPPPGVEATYIGPVSVGPGDTIDSYKVLEQIGEGGFGVVFLAEQEQPVRRKVALKIIKPGMDTKQVIARFEAERQVLAMMDHPNIAKVHDAGTTGEGTRGRGLGTRVGNIRSQFPARSPQPPTPHPGRPYFVMELVQGVPITEYCDQCHLTTRERLELFVTVCQAVQHAHQRGIIHRDLKPTNVLVAMQDGKPSPKIIDFGVAKAIGQRLTEHTLTTGFAQMVGSPLYMSPEQAELSPLGVDTRSDIYSLGVMLYELLAGATPFDKDRLHAASYDELRRFIREEEPPRPSARISTLAAELATTIAERRRTDTRRLCQQVRGELDWIVMKCLEKDRSRRYETASSLAYDIERYLNDEPVQACPPSAGYRFKKFIRRNKVWATFLLLLIAGLATLAVSNVMIQAALRQKNAALALAQKNELHATTEATKSKAVSDKLHQLIRRAMNEYGQVANDSPADFDRRMKAVLGFVGLIKVSAEAPGFSHEVDEINRHLTAELPQLLAMLPDSNDHQWQAALTYRDWGNSLLNYSKYLPVAELAFTNAKEILENLSVPDPKRHRLWLQLADTYSVLGEIQWRSARLQEADASFRDAMEIHDQHAAEIAIDPSSDAPTGIAIHYIRLAYFFAGTHREKEAAEFVRRTACATEHLTGQFELINLHYLIAIAQLQLDDKAGYRKTCKALVDVPVADVDDLTKVGAILAPCLAPDALEDFSLPVKRAEELAKHNSVEQPHIVPYALGAALYRDRQYDRAADELEKSVAANPSDPWPGFETINFQQLLLAMSKWQQGKRDEARGLLAETKVAVDQDLQSPSVHYISKAVLEALRREAEDLIDLNEGE